MDFGYDCIGDIHGELGAAERLLERMGYSRSGDGTWRHPSRTALFVGDFVDRGPEQVGTIAMARKMLAAGAGLATMGNHELNAIAFAAPDGRGSHRRARTSKNRAQHAAFLAAVGEDTPAHADAVAFFRTLPLWFETPRLRVVHACWHQPSIELLRGYVDDDFRLKAEHWEEALTRGTALAEAIDVILKGPEVALPAGHSFIDKDGSKRRALRMKWWDEAADTYRKAAISVPGDRVGELPDLPLDHDYRYDGEVPVVFGHYWMSGEPGILGPKATCVDFSVARPDGALAAYRWSGESDLSADNLVHVPAAEPAPAAAP